MADTLVLLRVSGRRKRAQQTNTRICRLSRRNDSLLSETQFSYASPFVDKVTGDVYWCNETGIWQQEPAIDGAPRLVNCYSPDFVKKTCVAVCHASYLVRGPNMLPDRRRGGERVACRAGSVDGK